MRATSTSRSRLGRTGGALAKRIAVHVALLTPFALLLLDFRLDRLTANPIQEITFRTGKFALLCLIASLAVSPANNLFGWRWAIPLRRTLGLYAFFYAVLHSLTFVWLDYGLDAELLKEALFEKPYALVGFSAFLILTPIALTSTQGWMRRLGKRWKKLHRLVYVAAALVIVHFTWLVKSDIREPLAFGVLVALLLAARLPRVRRVLAGWRDRGGGKGQRGERVHSIDNVTEAG